MNRIEFTKKVRNQPYFFIYLGSLTPKKRTALIAANQPLDDKSSLKNISLKVDFN